jgi:AcrR family transcriptional regulator
MYQSKSENLKRVSGAVVSILDQRGIHALTISAVSRESKVSRAWVYKYIGKNKHDLMSIAILQFAEIFGNLDSRNAPKNGSEWVDHLINGTSKLLENSLKYPRAMTLYYRYSLDKNPLGFAIQKSENEYLKLLAKETKAAVGCSEGNSQKFAQHFTLYRIALAHRYAHNKSFRALGAPNILQDVRRMLVHFLLG